MKLNLKTSSLWVTATALVVLATPVTSATAASSVSPTAGSAVVRRDPALGPHARDQARHAGDQLVFSPATAAPMPRRANVAPAGAPRQSSAAVTPSNESLRREVFGFAPYWALSATSHAYTNWNYSLLSTVAYFGLTFNGSGGFQSEQGLTAWNSAQLADMVLRAHNAGARVVLVVKSFDVPTICAVVYDGRTAAITNTINEIRDKKVDGVNVDFEGNNDTPCPNGQSVQSGVTGFMTQLSTQVHAQVPNSFVTIDTYSGAASWDSGEFKIGDLAPVVDALFIMAYDMESSNNPGHAGPTAPLNGWTYNDTTSVQQYLSKAPASKVILGVPYYGIKWSTADGNPYSVATSPRTPDTYTNIGQDFACSHPVKQWDSTASVWWASWFSPPSGDPCGGNYNSWRELYYDDAESLGFKYDLVNNAGLRGTGMWTLDYQGTSTDLWNELSLKFVSHWDNLGGPLGSGPDASSWGSNRLDAFVRGTNNGLWHRFWDGNAWRWESLGGVISSAPGAVSWTNGPNGRIDVFVRGTDQALWHRAFDALTGIWANWESLGGMLGSAPDASSSGPGLLDVFVRGTDGGLWHRGYGPTGWMNWNKVGGLATFTEKPSAVSANGHTDVFVRGTDQALWHCTYDGTVCGNWQSLGGVILNGPGASTWGPNRLDVFVRGSDSRLWHRWFDGTAWSDWTNSIGTGAVLTDGPSAVSANSGRIDVFIRGTDYSLWHLGVNIS